MIAATIPKTQVLSQPNVELKLEGLSEALQLVLKGAELHVPFRPGRDVQILKPSGLPDKKGLSTREGQARLVHDLASIELQAMELGLRTLTEFPLAPREFRQELAQVTAEEGKHLGLCLTALVELGYPWGSFPTHTALWECTDAQDSLLGRIVIVHRYLEGSGFVGGGAFTAIDVTGGAELVVAYFDAG